MYINWFQQNWGKKCLHCDKPPMTNIYCSYLPFPVLYRQLCELYVSNLSPSGWLGMTCMWEGVPIGNCCFDFTEDCSKAFYRNVTIVTCHNERVKYRCWDHISQLQLLRLEYPSTAAETTSLKYNCWDYISQAQLLRSHQALKLGCWDHISQAQLLGPHLKHSCWDHISSTAAEITSVLYSC